MKYDTKPPKDIKETTKVESRNEKFAAKISTTLWQEIPDAENPYIARRTLCHGYDTVDLLKNSRYIDTLYLLFKGELPSEEQAGLFEKLMIILINPGPRHNATRAAMNAGAGKTEAVHILPIALSIFGGNHLGGLEVQNSMRFIKDARHEDPVSCAEKLITNTTNLEPTTAGDKRIAPGFGSLYGSIDPMAKNWAAELIAAHPASKNLYWAQQFAETLSRAEQGLLIPGLAASLFLDLGFDSRTGATLYQLLAAPGLLAHGLEMSSRPVTDMPFLAQEHYHIES